MIRTTSMLTSFRIRVRPLMAPAIVALTAAVTLGGCFSVTRTESELYTITLRDTTVREDVVNTPGQRDGGTIYPSPRTSEISRRYLQTDSTVQRHYPAFMRFGGIEAMSFLAGGSTSDGAGNGLFGLYDLLTARKAQASGFFHGWFYRLVPYESRLRWLDDDPNWSIGTAALEGFFRKTDDSSRLNPGEYLIGVFPGYIRKRYVLQSEAPSVMVTPFVGVSWFPSQYLNIGATLDVGSFGGFNARAYLGLVTGSSSWFAEQEDRRDYSATFPYVGIGVSALDFVNQTEELFIEWKDHDHNAIEVSALSFDMVRSFSAEDGFLGDSATGNEPAVSGFVARLGSANFPLPVADGKLWVGTTLLNVMGLSGSEFGYGILPIRIGYRQPIVGEQFNIEPFLEVTYYPSTIFHLGARASIRVAEWTRASFVLGFASGTTPADAIIGVENAFTEINLQNISDFSTVYAGVGIGIGDVVNTVEEVRRR